MRYPVIAIALLAASVAHAADQWVHPIELEVDAKSNDYNNLKATIDLIFEVKDPGPAQWKVKFEKVAFKKGSPTGPVHNRFNTAMQDPYGCTDNAKASAVIREVHIQFFHGTNPTPTLTADWEEPRKPAPASTSKVARNARKESRRT